MPKRIQRKRTKGWKMPEGAVYVGRPTKWGNPFIVGQRFAPLDVRKGQLLGRPLVIRDSAHAVALFREQYAWVEKLAPSLRELRGKDLACWCPLVDANGNKVPCHADVLLEWANAGGDA